VAPTTPTKPAVTPTKPAVTPTKPIVTPTVPAKPAAKPDCSDSTNKDTDHCKKQKILADVTHPDYDCKKDPNVQVNWDGDCVRMNTPWYDDKLFTVKDFDFTIGDALLTTMTIIVLSAIGFAISSYIAWRKRKAIAAGARRMSASIKRASIRLRDSIVGPNNRIGQADELSSNDEFDTNGQKLNMIAAHKD
jgi:hypothetical protein